MTYMQAMRPANEAAKKKWFFVCPTSDSSATPLKRAGARRRLSSKPSFWAMKTRIQL
jgi:hypothetical protein